VTFACPFAILILLQYARLISFELDDAARVDGASAAQVYLRIYLPLMWREGDTVTLAVTNRLAEPSSIHWHGIRTPSPMDGVPGLSFAGIPPGETYVYRFPVHQSGTYWYHSHSEFQEQTGVYGSIVIEPKGGYAQRTKTADAAAVHSGGLARMEWYSFNERRLQEVSMIQLSIMLAVTVPLSATGSTAHSKMAMQTFPVLAGAGAHDVYPAPDGAVWFTAQSAGKLGRLDPKTGKSDLIALGPDAAPHGVIVGPDGAAWVTEGGQNAIARVDPKTRSVKLFPPPEERRNANLNTASFDLQGVLWFTGQNGIYGRLDTKTGAMAVFDAPRGAGPYGIATTPDGQVFFASLAGNYLGQVDLRTGAATVLEPPVPRQGARRVWSDSRDDRTVQATRDRAAALDMKATALSGAKTAEEDPNIAAAMAAAAGTAANATVADRLAALQQRK
jgi:hypothetical protein